MEYQESIYFYNLGILINNWKVVEVATALVDFIVST